MLLQNAREDEETLQTFEHHGTRVLVVQYQLGRKPENSYITDISMHSKKRLQVPFVHFGSHILSVNYSMYDVLEDWSIEPTDTAMVRYSSFIGRYRWHLEPGVLIQQFYNSYNGADSSTESLTSLYTTNALTQARRYIREAAVQGNREHITGITGEIWRPKRPEIHNSQEAC